MVRAVASVLLLLLASAAGAGDLVLGPGFSSTDLAQLTAVMADAIAFPQLAEAPPLGWAGFHLLAAAGGPSVSTRAPWWNAAMKDRVVGEVLVAPRVVARKGLPMRLDLGAQVGKVFGYTFWGGEVAWGLMEGGALLPAVGLAAVYGRLEGAPVSLKTGEVRLCVSKGFPLLTPFASLGYRRERGGAIIEQPFFGFFLVEEDRVTGTAGVVMGIPPLRVVAEVRRAATTGIYLGVGVGL